MDEFSIRQRLALAQELKARRNCAAGVRTYVMDVESLLGEIERLKTEHFEMQKSIWASVDVVLQRDQLKVLAETYRVKLAKLCEVVTCYASAGNIEVYYHENPKSPCLSDVMDEARKALEEGK